MAQNMKAVKTRIRSVQSTMQITKAMELVASSKLRRAKERADNCRPYFKALYRTLQAIACGNTDFASVYASPAQQEKTCYILVAGDRGLAGGYNSNIFKCFEATRGNRECIVLPIGKKAVEYVRRRGYACMTEEFAQAGSISVADCFSAARLVCRGFTRGEYGHVVLVYTEFVNMLTQRTEAASLLPLTDLKNGAEENEAVRSLILYEPDSSIVFERIVPEFIGGVLYCGICEGTASEQAARRTAMESATSNAEDMIDRLSLSYNRARQASITQEITEIVGGAEGL